MLPFSLWIIILEGWILLGSHPKRKETLGAQRECRKCFFTCSFPRSLPHDASRQGWVMAGGLWAPLQPQHRCLLSGALGSIMHLSMAAGGHPDGAGTRGPRRNLWASHVESGVFTQPLILVSVCESVVFLLFPILALFFIDFFFFLPSVLFQLEFVIWVVYSHKERLKSMSYWFSGT